MVRTQIYLSDGQRRRLAALAALEGENVSGLIREAVEQYISRHKNGMRAREQACTRVFDKAFGMWKDNKTDFAAIRESADRTWK